MKGENNTSILDDRKLRSSSLKKCLENGQEIKDGADCFCPYFCRQRVTGSKPASSNFLCLRDQSGRSTASKKALETLECTVKTLMKPTMK